MAGRKISTMAEFAAVSRISRPTVAKYFDDPASIRETTRTRIEKALAEFDYRPNLFAVNLNRKKARIIGVVVPSTTDPFYAEITRHVQLNCLRSGYLAIVLSSHGERELEKRAVQTLRSLKAAGVILAPLGFSSDDALLGALGADIPLVFFDSRLDEAAAFVGTDNAQSISLVVDYLARTGEPPCFLEMPEVNHNAAERRAAYLAAMARLRLQPELIHPEPGHGWDFEKIGYLRAISLIDGPGFPTKTVLCANDRLAFGVMAAACSRRVRVGRHPGSGLRVAGHDDHPLSRYICPALTTVAQDIELLGKLCTDILLAKIGPGGGADAAGTAPAAGSGGVKLDARLMMRESA